MLDKEEKILTLKMVCFACYNMEDKNALIGISQHIPVDRTIKIFLELSWYILSIRDVEDFKIIKNKDTLDQIGKSEAIDLSKMKYGLFLLQMADGENVYGIYKHPDYDVTFDNVLNLYSVLTKQLSKFQNKIVDGLLEEIILYRLNSYDLIQLNPSEFAN
jgi:hypothetical protein